MISIPRTNLPLIAPSLLSADFSRLGEQVRAVIDAGADLLHIDVMDGHFVPNITIGPFIVEAIKKVSSIPLDVHLMIMHPDRYLQAFADAGADIITVHYEASTHLHRTIEAIHHLDVRAGVSVNPATSVSLLEDILSEVDLVLLMSVNPGFGGQKFIRDSLRKAALLRQMIADKAAQALIEMDGGISKDNAAEVCSAGVDILVSGSAIFTSKNYAEYIHALRSRT